MTVAKVIHIKNIIELNTNVQVENMSRKLSVQISAKTAIDHLGLPQLC